MIHYLKGVVTDSQPGMLVLEASGIGYEINVPDGSEALLSLGTGETVTLYTAMIVREDDVSLYGFSDKESLAMFRLLMTVSGVGAKAAMAILSVMDTAHIAQAIVYEDAAAITKANGVGKKTAQRIVLDLRDKVDGFTMINGGEGRRPVPGKNEARDLAASALMNLGLTRTEALTALASIPEEDLSIEEYIRRALAAR